MDFHGLTRKELQTLCKRNKIPANITNVAMADALKSLEIVEGLEELKNRCQSPEKTTNKASQEIPSTVTRTSTRRKTIIEEYQSTQSTTRTRARKITRTMELDEENKNVNVSETPVMASTTSRRRAQKPDPEVMEQGKSDLLETPALQSCRRKPGVGSTRRKVEAQKERSLQHGYGTRRSVRLLEKTMDGLSLKESEKMEEPVKIDEMVEGEVENKNGQSGATSEVPLARNLSASLEDERELKDDVVENSEFNNGESDCTLISEAGSRKSDNLDSLFALVTKDVSLDEENNEPEAENKLADIPDGSIDPTGSDHIAISEDLHEIVNLNQKSVADEIDDVAVSKDLYEIDNLNEELVVDETKSIDVLVAEAVEDISEEVLDHSSTAAGMEPIDVVSAEPYANHSPQEIEWQKLLGKDCDNDAVDDDLTKLPEADEIDDVAVSKDSYQIDNLNEELVVDETRSIDVLAADAVEDISEEVLDHSSTAAGMEPIDAVSAEPYANHSPQAIEWQKLLGKDCDNDAADDDLTKLPEADEIDDVAVSKDSYQIDNLNEELVVDETRSIDVLVADAVEDISEEVLYHSSTAADMEPVDVVSAEPYTNHSPQEIEWQKLLGKDCDNDAVDDDLTKLPEADEIDDVAVLKDSHEIDNLNEEMVVDETRSIDVLVADAVEDIFVEVLYHSSTAADMEPIDVVSAEPYANAAKQIECQKVLGKDYENDAVDDCLTKLPEAEEYDEGEVSKNVSVLPKGHMDYSEKKGNKESDVDAFLGDSDIDDDTGSENNSLADELQEEVLCEQKCISIPTAAYSSEDPMTSMVDEEALVDVNVAEAEIIHESSLQNVSQSVVDDTIPVHKIVNDGDAEALVDTCVEPAKEFTDITAKLMSPSPCPVSNSEIITTSMPLSPLTAEFSQPTSFTPSKSLNKKQTTTAEVTHVIDNNINKENINSNSVKEVEPCLGKLKKNKNIIDEETMQNLQGMSLRNLKKLTKMFDKLEITDNMKNKGDKNVSKCSAAAIWEEETCLANTAPYFYAHWRSREAKLKQVPSKEKHETLYS